MKLWTQAINNPFQIILLVGFLFGFSLPFSTKIGNILLIIFIVGIAFLYFKGNLKFNKTSLAVLKYSSIVLIVACFLGLVFHGNFLTVLNVIGKRITYVLLPLSFLFLAYRDLMSLRKYALRGLVYGSIMASLILLANNLFGYYATRPFLSVDNELFGFYYTGFNFTEIFDIHPSYFGMYILLSIGVLLFGKINIPQGLRLLGTIFFFFIVLFLSSRMVLFFCFITVLIYILRSFLILFGNSRVAILSFLSAVLLIFFTIYFLIKETYIYTSLTEETVWELSFNVNDKYNSKTEGDSRVARWDVALDLFKEHPITGYGIGNEKDILEMGYRKEGMFISAKNRYDSHNLFLGYSLEAGILGVLILVYYLFSSIVFFFRFKEVMYILFFLSIMGMCLIENYLNNNAAITFVAFFGNLFLFEIWLAQGNKKDERP